MERAMTSDEKIRKIEDRYYQKRTDNTWKNNANVRIPTSSPKDKKKKIVLKILICAVLYTIFQTIETYDYTFSNTVLEKTKECLSYDVNVGEEYSKITNIFQSEEQAEEQIATGGEIQEESNNTNTIEETLSAVEDNNSGAGEISTEEVASSISQMGEDAEAIRKNISFINPLKGTITSRYGVRESTNTIVTPFHTGIDIGVEEGREIVSAIDGTVSLVSDQGAYRKSCENSKW